MKTIEISPKQQIRIEHKSMNGKNYVDVRVFFKKRGDIEWQHSRKGIMIPDEHADAAIDGISDELQATPVIIKPNFS